MGRFEEWLSKQPQWVVALMSMLFAAIFIGTLWLATVLGAAFVEN